MLMLPSMLKAWLVQPSQSSPPTTTARPVTASCSGEKPRGRTLVPATTPAAISQSASSRTARERAASGPTSDMLQVASTPEWVAVSIMVREYQKSRAPVLSSSATVQALPTRNPLRLRWGTPPALLPRTTAAASLGT